MITENPESVEIEVLAAVDAAFREASRRAGEWLACGAGCDECCRKPFAITAQDARRLQAGLRTLSPSEQTDIQERARAARQAVSHDFPGDLAAGELTESGEWRDWFFARHNGLACPVLNLETGECRLYQYRPVACRLAGPLIQIGATITDPCHLCFQGVGVDEILSTKVEINDPCFVVEASEVESLVAFVL